ncbi:UDP-N-acetylmuramoyl-L-alanyl-D-glutamate--2,6-diaminopimelate ligase [Rothia kristinae]|uniref:UDP-N-acetylmuramyl-tripeptide synthetase n=1 Tax=Rothia kristinae TaxID=37923 RepID=A0A7T4T4P2_9MICC|nr:UDP-N-acetylmuramoyl-L-alanyl-D-glutamate--2,6-diaminopimelate ligase [Rothia kristinae]QQC59805.1 UDP-N-acetylmuramoyl-L-alanyl-D-glutamate--2,6-diaminopimelate ligase [Rothia kristinae]
MTPKDPEQGHPDLQGASAQDLRPRRVPARELGQIAARLEAAGVEVRTRPGAEGQAVVTGISMDSREVQAGDLYVALPGANAHGAQFCAAARRAGAVAVLTDAEGAGILDRQGSGLPLLIVPFVREAVGPLAAWIYGSQPERGRQRLYAVTGTNGKTTTTYMIDGLLDRLGETTGLIGTIEIRAGAEVIPSTLTTPESTHVHALLSVMRERGITAAAMEVSSHALDYRRVDGVVYDVAGFTNLTQDHLDLHGSMQAYFDAKAQLFTPARTRRAVIIVDDEWGRRMAEHARRELGADRVVTLATGYGRGAHGEAEADWTVREVRAEGIGHGFVLQHRDGTRIPTGTGLPADFNVSNAALAAVMVRTGQTEPQRVAEQLADPESLTPLVPGRMQVIGQRPLAIVDFAHNPDALQRALEAVGPGSDGRVIVVFGATGERDQLKRPIMGRIAAEHADVVIVTDDDPHREPPAPIRAAVAEGARAAAADGARAEAVEDIAPRADAIRRAVELAGPGDAILVAGRGHETSQDVDGADLELDDREELRAALAAHRPAPTDTPEDPAGERA